MPQTQLTVTRAFPERVIVHWRRFSQGLWRAPEGDISSAYCADTFPILKAFSHEGTLYANLGNTFSSDLVHTEAHAYPLLHPEDGPRLPTIDYSYQGQEGLFRRKKFWLGPRVIFETDDPSVQEWRDLLRAAYADGGYFASQKTYADFLASRAEQKSNLRLAVLLEMEHDLRLVTKEGMLRFLEGAKSTPSSASASQIELNLGG